MKVILDTNVIISSIFFGGIPSQLIEACYEKRIKLVMSPAILIDLFPKVGTLFAAW